LREKFEIFSGSVDRIIDGKAEKVRAVEEKFTSV